jgi:glycosyltransferase 2 family protein
MNAFYGAPIEAATACGALLLFVTFLSIIPAGLIAARLNHVNLRHAAEAATAETTPAE